MIDIVIVFLGAFAAAFLGSMSGGGAGFVSFFALLMVGVPAPMAIGTNKIGDLGFFLPAIYNYSKTKYIVKDALKVMIGLGIVGGILGSLITISLNEEVLNLSLSVIIICFVGFLLWKNKVGLEEGEPNKWWTPSYFLSSIYSGFVGMGSGAISVFLLCMLRKMTFLQACATNFSANLVIALVSIPAFIYAELIRWDFVLYLFIGNIIGAYFGSKIAIKKGNNFIRTLLICVMVITAIRLLI